MMPPKGRTGAKQAKAAAAADAKQNRLSFVRMLRSSPPKRKAAELVTELPPLPRPASRKPRRLDVDRSPRHTSSTHDAPPLPEAASTVLELKAVVHDVVHQVISMHEQDASARALECHSWLDACIDRV